LKHVELNLPVGVRESLCGFARSRYPHEACGLLIGESTDSLVEVMRAVETRNLLAGEAGDRFEVDPGEHVAAQRVARDEGLDVVGVWHSHPDHPARPSARDLAGAWEGWSYLIVAVDADGVGELRSWRLEGGHFVEQELRDGDARGRGNGATAQAKAVTLA